MLKVLYSEPTVFGFAPQPPAVAPQKKPLNDTLRNDPNDEIIRATKEIQASIERAKSNRNLYIVSAFAIAIIGYLTYQNNNLSQKVHNLHNSFQRFSAPTTPGLPNIKIDNCLQTLAFLLPRQPDKTEGSYLKDILNKPVEQQVEYLCTVHPTLGADFQGNYVSAGPLSIFGALISQNCQSSLNSLVHLLDKFSTSTIRECLEVATKVLKVMTHTGFIVDLYDKCYQILEKRDIDRPDDANKLYLDTQPLAILENSDPRLPALPAYHRLNSHADHITVEVKLNLNEILALFNTRNNDASFADIDVLIQAESKAKSYQQLSNSYAVTKALTNAFNRNAESIEATARIVGAYYEINPELFKNLMNKHPNATEIQAQVDKLISENKEKALSSSNP